MSLGCLRLGLALAVRAACRVAHSANPVAHLPSGPRPHRPLRGHLGVTFPFSTMVGDDEVTTQGAPKKKKKQNQNARVTIGSVGRKIHQPHLLLLNEQGENLGTMHRADALRLLDETGLKLIPINRHSNPPVYQMMSGKQIHVEQMKQREKEKAKAGGPVQVKDVTLSLDISPHHLDVKMSQVASWLEKHHHVRLALKAKNSSGSRGTAPDTTLHQLVQRLQVPVGFVSKPKVTQDGRTATCTLRQLTAKELQQLEAQQGAERPAKAPKPDADQQPPSSTSQLEQSKAPSSSETMTE